MPVHIRERKRSSGKTYLFLDIYEDGKRVQESTGLWYSNQSQNKRDIKKKARELARQRETEIAKGKPLEKSSIDFIEYFEEKAKGKHTPYGTTLHHLKLFREKNKLGKLPFKKFDERIIRKFADYLLDEISQNTALSLLGYVKAVLNIAVREKIIVANPGRYVTIKKIDTERSFLTIDELRNMAAAHCPNKEVKRGFLFGCYTGLRYSDIKNLTWGNIKDDKIHFRQKKTKGYEYIPLNEQAKKLAYEGLQDNVIPLPDQKIFNIPSSASTCVNIRKWSENAEIEKHLTFHSSRHTFATLAITQGVDIYTVSKLLGHKELRNTEIYAKIIDSKMSEAVNKLPILEGLK